MHTRTLIYTLGLSLILLSCGQTTSEPKGYEPLREETVASVSVEDFSDGPATISALPYMGLVPHGYQIVKGESGEVIAEGDLNGDEVNDAAILIQNLDEEQGSAAILVVHGEPGDKFYFGEMSGNLGPEPLSYPDPEQLKIENGVLIFHYQSMRWSADLKFRKEAKYGDLRLIGTDTESYGNAVHDGAGSSSTNYLTGERISNYMSWNEEKQDLDELPEKREKVSTKLKPFSNYNEDSLYNGL